MEYQEAEARTLKHAEPDMLVTVPGTVRWFFTRSHRSLQRFPFSRPLCLGNQERIREYAKKYREENKEVIAQKAKNYQEKNRETLAQKGKKYREENKEILALKAKKYREENKETLALKTKKYREERKDIFAQKFKKYREENKETLALKAKKYRENKKIEASAALQSHPPEPPRFLSWKTQTDIKGNLDKIGQTLLIQNLDDWYRVGWDQIALAGGGRIRTKFNSLFEALTIAYPDHPWVETLFSIQNKKAAQRWLLVQLQQLLPVGTTTTENFRHPQLLSSIGLPMEIDIWVPKHKIAIEYQGENHYHGHIYGNLEMKQARDQEKAVACAQAGITLIQIPYWWDKSRDSLQATLHQIQPSLFADCGTSPIPHAEPTPTSLKDRTLPSLMHGIDWVGQKQDPSGWIISEKMDGIRCFWDGSRLLTRGGLVINAPDWFVSSLPRDIPLDGELYTGYDNRDAIRSVFARSRYTSSPELWAGVQFLVFDAPNHDADYRERHSYAKSTISNCDPHIKLVPIQTCSDLNHLYTVLDQVKAKGGEGLMLYHPSSRYTPGRGNLVQKVVIFDEAIVTYLTRSSKGKSFHCQQEDGTPCVVRTPAFDYYNPPPVGSRLRIKHLGIHKKTRKFQSAALVARMPRVIKEKSPGVHEILNDAFFSDSATPTYLTFDIETNDHPNQNPFMIELGWCLFDQEGKILKGYPTSHLVQPEDVGPTYVGKAAHELHGISFEQIQKEGTPFSQVFKLFLADLKKINTTEVGRIGSYNLEFDQEVLFKFVEDNKKIELQRLIKENGICVMNEATKIQKARTKLDVAFHKLAKLPKDTKLKLLEQAHQAATDALLAGFVLLSFPLESGQ